MRAAMLGCSFVLLGSPTGCWGTPSASKGDPAAGETSTGPGAGDSPTTTPITASTNPSTTTALDDTLGTTIPDPTEATFLTEPDLGTVIACDLWAQDCPRGEKCTAYANDGGSSWNATKCVSVVDDPVGAGETCHAEGSGTSGIDDCELGAMCWDVDHDTLEGFCLPFCAGDESNPQCEDPNRSCSVDAGLLAFCVLACSPVEQDCSSGQACYPVQDDWMCHPDASGDVGAYGDPCEHINECDPGLICLDAAIVPPGQPCEGAAGCCTEICDLADPTGDLQCAGAAAGQECQPWYGAGAAPAGYEDVGACALPT